MWSSSIIDELARLKATGATFEYAWREALEACPPKRRDLGPEAMVLFGSEDEEPLVDFLYRVCGDAWHGRHPLLRHVMVLSELVGMTDVFVPSRRRRGTRHRMLDAA